MMEIAGRFEVERTLGEGAFGVVYQVYDRERRETVALKRLRHVRADLLRSFKNEFRALADVSHPNLVKLEELIRVGDDWLLTMELVEGCDILSHVRDSAGHGSGDGGRSTSEFRFPFDERRVRDSFAQLAEGVRALHDRGMVHRDLKPSNVLVDHNGRVVILDFGIVAAFGSAYVSGPAHFMGTPAYTSPEQVQELPLSPAADWYSTGVMLFEALTGRLPFMGTASQLLAQRVHHEPAPPRELIGGVPRDLDQLCQQLLRLDASARPEGADIVRCLRGTPSKVHEGRAQVDPQMFVGRQQELAKLRRALGEVGEGQSVLAHLTGAPGLGKSALARRFLDELSEMGDTLVLSGRCYERETGAYKAVDPIIDELTGWLAELPADELTELLPHDWLALARLFPVIQDLGSSLTGRVPTLEIPDLAELRRRGLAAFRELFRRLTRAKTVVLFIDDVQWGDEDSGLLLRELLRPPAPPPLLLVVSCRSEDRDASPLLRTLYEGPIGATELDMRLAELGPDEARELALHRVDPSGGGAQERAAVLARESGGNPFLLGELARHRGPTDDFRRALDLEDVVAARVSTLPHDSRRLLETIAIAGQPIPMEVANRAAGLDPRNRSAADSLLAEQWLSRGSSGAGELLEIYHDRIREVVAARVPPGELVSHHNRLAAAWESSNVADAETLAEHYRSAGDPEVAYSHARRAAEEADAALAFDRAARLYRLALSLWLPSTEERVELHARLATALANAGRGAEAGEEFFWAAQASGPGRRRELTRRAGEEHLKSGAIERGLELTASALEMAGLTLPKSPRRAILTLLFRLGWLRVRGFGYRPRRVSEVPPDLLVQVDTSWSAALGLMLVDVARGTSLATSSLLLALRSGEPLRIARAMAMHASIVAAAGSRSEARISALKERCRELTDQVDDPYVSAFYTSIEGAEANLGGRFRESLEVCARAEGMLRADCTGVSWELATARLWQLQALINLGRWREVGLLAPQSLEEARARGDRFLTTYIRVRNMYLVALAADDAELARRRQAGALDEWGGGTFQVQHYWDLFARCEIALYEGHAEEAWRGLRARWGDFRRSLLPTTTQALEVEARCLSARAAVALAAESRGSQRRGLLRSALRDARRLEAQRVAWASAQARLVRACAESFSNRSRAAEGFRLAEVALVDVGMSHYAAAADWARARMEGRPPGERALAANWAAREGVASPERIFAMLAPIEND